MSASKSKLFAYSSLALIIFLGLAPLTSVGAKTITIGSSSTDIVQIPGLLVNTSLTGAGNRCLYVDGNNQLSVKGFDCGSSTGGDNLGDHSATQNLRLNTFWLSGDGGNEGIQIGSTGNMTTSGTVSFTGVVYAGGGNRMITVDNAGVLGAATIPVDTNTDIFWTGTATNLVAATGRTSLGLGALATLGSVGNALITDVAWSKITGFPAACSAGQYVSAVGGTLTCSTPAGGVSGSGTTNIVSKWTGTSSQGNSTIYDNGTSVGINTTSPSSANVQINAATTLEALRLVSAASYSPLNIRNSGNTADIFRVDQTGSLAVGTVPWARLASYPAACSAGQYVTAVGGTLTCATPTDNNTDIYWTGTATNLVAATGRTSLGLGALATLSTVANAQITDMAWSKLTGFPAACSAGQYVTAVGGTLTCATPAAGADIYWTGTATNLVAATGRTSLGLGALATLSTVANAQITDVAWSKITGFPAACSAGQYVTAVGGTLTCATPAGGVSGSGTANMLSKWTGTSALGNSIIYDDGTYVGIGTSVPGTYKLNVNGTTNFAGNLTTNGTVSFTGVVYAGGGNRMITVDNAGVLGAAAIPVDTNTDIYWTGTATNLVAATGRTSLGLGALATLGAVSGGTGGTITDGTITDADVSASAAIASSKIQNGTFFITSAGTNGQIWTSDGVGAGIWAAPGASTDIYWTGTATNLVAATGRTSLGLGALATLSTVANAQITDVAWSKITGFPAACSAGQYVTAVGGTLTCATPAGGVSGSGTTNMLSKWTGTSSQGNSTIYDNGTSVGINTTSPSSANMQINAATTLEALRLVSAASYSPLNIRNSGNTADIFRVDQSGSIAVGTVPWARLASYPAACSAGQYVSAVGGTLTCSTPAAGADIYWTGTATNLVAATGRTSLGLGALATLGAVSGGTGGTITDGTITDADVSASAAIASSKIQNGTFFITSAGTNGQIWTSDGVGAGIWAAPGASTDIYWTGTATNLVAATGRTSLGLGALATLNTVANAQITDVAWSKITGFPAACTAGQYVTTVGGTLTCSTPAAGADIYWTGTATNLVAATGRTSLGLGALATLGAVSGGTGGTITDATITDADISATAAIASSKIQNGAYFISSPGTYGQVWTSVGTGAGNWGTPTGIGGSGTEGMISYWADANGNLGETNIFYDRENIGISTTLPGAKLHVNGSLLSNSSVTFSLLGGGGTRAVTVDNAGNLGATTFPSALPSGTAGQTLQNNGSGSWVASSYLANTGTYVNVNYPFTEACNAKMNVNGYLRSTAISVGPFSTSSCMASMNITPDQIQFLNAANSITSSAAGMSFSNNVAVLGGVDAKTGFAVNGTAGLSVVVNVKGSNNVNCSMTFVGGILTAETCP